MLQEALEPAWVDAFEAVPARCALRPGDRVAINLDGALVVDAGKVVA